MGFFQYIIASGLSHRLAGFCSSNSKVCFRAWRGLRGGQRVQPVFGHLLSADQFQVGAKMTYLRTEADLKSEFWLVEDK